jgi:hypothetical protein
MNFSTDFLRRLLTNPAESLDVEFKDWLDPTTPEGIAKIAKACLALRNNDGGCLLIGFDNNGKPTRPPDPEQTRTRFHIDAIQGIVSSFASQAFEVRVEFVEHQGTVYPAICVPSGIVTPVAANRDLRLKDQRVIEQHGIYVRSLRSNNTPSSTLARTDDWEALIKRCFDNREADIGSFIRRHLSAENLNSLGSLLAQVGGEGWPPRAKPSVLEQARDYLDTGREKFAARVKKQKAKLPNAGTLEATAIISGSIPEHSANREFLTNLQIRKPHHTGWTPWIDSSGSGSNDSLPYVDQEGWEALVIIPPKSPIGESVDFWRIDPKGLFYQLRYLEDDLRGPAGGPITRTEIDFALHVHRVAEIISICFSFARTMGCEEKDTTIAFAFRWRGLEGRRLGCWANPRRSFYSAGVSQQDEITTSVSIPLEVPHSGLGGFVDSATKSVFELFGGTRFQPQVIEEIVNETLKQRY